jgi:hypothetical protein
MSLKARLDVLPDAQRALWPKLREVPKEFVLYGGTALALRLGHRTSVDFDFFSSEPFQPARLRSNMDLLAHAETLDVSVNTLTVATPVKLSFFGGLKLGRVGEPEMTSDGVIQVASLLDCGACKMAVVQERAQAKDYLDVYALLKNGLKLPDMLGAAAAAYGEQFNPAITLKALTYFKDGDLPGLPDEVKKTLCDSSVSVRDIPTVPRKANRLN